MKYNKKTAIIILICIMILQIVLRIYIGNKKEYFHMDEAYSYGLMNYDKLSIVDNEDFFNNWHNQEYYLDYLEVNSDEFYDLKPVYENQKNDVHPPLYYLLLRISASFTKDVFSKWTGIILNIILFVISNIFTYKVAKMIFDKNKETWWPIIICTLNGFTLISLNSTIYIRMYELANLMVIITTYFHLKMINKEEICFKDLLRSRSKFNIRGTYALLFLCICNRFIYSFFI